ncbi:MAG TPA: hypothetical protein VGL03_09835 [Thermoanaerobaculia bacterium]|jgi:hypothetical protein
MKKTVMTCLAIAALLAVASTAGAITCTVDQRPGATLLVPWFQVSVDANGAIIGSGPDARDTLVTIANASAAPMIAHVNVFSERTELVLDFNIALTGFDVQAFSMANVLTGLIPSTGFDSPLEDACQKNPNAVVYVDDPLGVGFIRVRPTSPAFPTDNTQAITLYPTPAWSPASSFFFQVLDSLDDTPDSHGCAGDVDGVISGLEHGYIVIDMVNYCTLSNPAFNEYYANDAIGMENNLWGEIIFTSGAGLPTYGMSTVNIESDPEFAIQDDITRARTFYARYWTPSSDPSNTPANCANCTAPDPEHNLGLSAPWNIGLGDQREPLGLKWAARWINAGNITTNFRVWRASISSATNFFPDLLDGGDCDTVEPVVTLNFFDEDENTVTTGGCVSPCENPSFNFPLETQQSNINNFSTPAASSGWVDMSFVNNTEGDVLDEAWVDYSFEGSSAFLSVLVPGTQLDPSTCNPLGITGVQVVTPVIPSVPTGTGL